MKKAFKILFIIIVIASLNTLLAIKGINQNGKDNYSSGAITTVKIKESNNNSYNHKLFKLLHKQILHAENISTAKTLTGSCKNRQNWWHSFFTSSHILQQNSSKLCYIKQVSDKLLTNTRKENIIYPFHNFW